VEDVEQFQTVEERVREIRRWYADGGATCLAQSERNELLEPFPTFGPTSYRRLARRASFREANAYAQAHGFVHLRDRPSSTCSDGA